MVGYLEKYFGLRLSLCPMFKAVVTLFCMLSLCVWGSSGQYGSPTQHGSYSGNKNITDGEIISASKLTNNVRGNTVEYYGNFYGSRERRVICMDDDVYGVQQLFIGKAICEDKTRKGNVRFRYCNRRTVRIKCNREAVSLKDCFVYPDNSCCHSVLQIHCSDDGGNSGGGGSRNSKPLSTGVIAVISIACISFCSCCCGLLWKWCKGLAKKASSSDDDDDDVENVARNRRVTSPPLPIPSATPLLTGDPTSPPVNPDHHEVPSGFDVPPGYGEVRAGRRGDPPPPSYAEAIALGNVWVRRE